MDKMNLELSDYKDTMAVCPTGIAVVTCVRGASLTGMTINSLSSLSLDPMLVMFNALKTSYVGQAIVEHRKFTLNILSTSQKKIANIFAVPSKVDFTKIDTDKATYSKCPIIKGVLSYIDCKLYQTYDGGDHIIIVGKVMHIEKLIAGEPLMYQRRNYRKIGNIIE
jgi:flavin reductase (DIM6/NTAB) family NADH-FMN oxidoreductase RutF